MNSNTLDKTKDPGKDGTVYPSGVFAARNERVAKDVVGFSLGYYGGDYSPIGGNPAEAAYAGTAFGNGTDDLFNGNIRHMVTAIEGLAIQGYAYRYDQLQRIKHMQVYRASDVQSLFAWTNSSATDEYKTTFSYDRNGNLTTLNRNGIGAELDMDRFVYNYHMIGGEPSNRLDYVTDNGTDYASYEDIKSGQTSGNYTYNKIGELVSDVSESMILHWRTGDHKLSKIERTDQDSPQIEFFYTAFGQRAMKVEKPRVSGVIQSASNWKYTYYAYDANGQVMAVYSGNFQGSSEQVKLSEQHLYGGERLGMITRDVVLFDNGVTSYTHKEEDVVHGDERGFKRYELLGHTNSVLAVISDRKMYNSVDGNYEPVMISWADYYAFGMLQSGRHGSATSELYRYLFQSMETDRGISGEGNSYTTEFRQYDPRLGRWKSLDPLMSKYPMMSPYVAFNNNPVFFIDPLGLEGVNPDGGNEGAKPPSRPGREYGEESFGEDGNIYIWSEVSDELTENGNKGVWVATSKTTVITPQKYEQKIEVHKNEKDQSQTGLAATLAILIETQYPLIEGVSLAGISMSAVAANVIAIPALLLSGDTRERPIDLPVAIPHGNYRDNPNEHIVYELFAYHPQTGEFLTLKYGVADSKYDTFGGERNRRPDSQINDNSRIRKYWEAKGYMVGNTILYRTSDRFVALSVEKLLVGIYMLSNDMNLPKEQLRPGFKKAQEIKKYIDSMKK
jgi:RHS repeat-associated protein